MAFNVSESDIRLILTELSKDYVLVKREDADTKEIFLNLDEYAQRLKKLLTEKYALDLTAKECYSLLFDTLTPPVEQKRYEENPYIELTCHKFLKGFQ